MEVHKALYLPRILHMEVHKALCLPRNLHMEVHKVLRLPRNLHMELHKVLRLPRNLRIEVHKVLCLPRNLHVKKQVKTLITMEERTGDHRRQPPTTQQPEPLTEHGGSQSAVPATNSVHVSVCVVCVCCVSVCVVSVCVVSEQLPVTMSGGLRDDCSGAHGFLFLRRKG